MNRKITIAVFLNAFTLFIVAVTLITLNGLGSAQKSPSLAAEIARKNASGDIVWGGPNGKAITFKACANGYAPDPPIPSGELRIYANLLVFNEGNGKLSCDVVDRKSLTR